jgi:predicted nucleic acid-binding protein
MPTAADPGGLVVVDASIVVTLLIDPAAPGDAVGERLAHSDLIAPALMPFEVANVLRRRRLAGRLSAAEAALAHGELADLPVRLWPWEAIAPRAWELGESLTSYDASYVALAELTNAALLTRDRRLANAPGTRCRIEVY